jgi:hypothetical protein
VTTRHTPSSTRKSRLLQRQCYVPENDGDAQDRTGLVYLIVKDGGRDNPSAAYAEVPGSGNARVEFREGCHDCVLRVSLGMRGGCEKMDGCVRVRAMPRGARTGMKCVQRTSPDLAGAAPSGGNTAL